MAFNKITENIQDLENQALEKWQDLDILEQSKNKKTNLFQFYEGPPTANGKPGIHHVMARTLKDSICRHKSMEGYYVPRKAGWDTHGLPVEIEVEKELDLFTKKDIEDYGIAGFNKKCKESVFKYEKMWREMTDKMGYLIDMDNPYITLDNDYIESVWYILKKFFDEALIYEGHKIMPFCPRCGTGLASHEVAQGYKDVKTNTVTCLFKRKDKDEYFLAWTTTPWTLLSNVALTVGEEIVYIKAEVLNDENHKGKHIYVSKNLADKVLGEGGYKVIEEMKGKDLENIEYEQLLPFIDVHKYGGTKSFIVTCNDYVSEEDGTGIVHTAPAFGEDDYNTGMKYNLPTVNPVAEDGKYLEGPWEGRFVLEDGLDVEIIKKLAELNVLFSKEKITHSYPHCWRCDTPLIYYSKKGFYIKTTALKEQLIKNNNEVNWFPDFVGEKRFGNWLDNLNDWAISRTRYWGTPIPLWRCEKCGKFTAIGSREELKEKALCQVGDDIELHRPYVDEISVKCDHCSSKANRIVEVLDCWFDSGAMPFAQMHYPFENKENFEKDFFPADFICEGIDQTRGWFYSLLVISTFLKGVSPYKNVLVNDLILDKNGKKMSKSKGNTVSPFDLFEKYGADAVRFYLLNSSPAWAPTKFDEDGVKDVLIKFFGTLKNVYQFFSLYANTDGVDLEFIKNKKEGAVERSKLDEYILSKFNNLSKHYIKALDEYKHMTATTLLSDFVIEDLSNWYIRRSRRRFFEKEMTSDKISAYVTTYEIIVGVAKLLSPIAPFISDTIFRNITNKESVHLEEYEPIIEDYINNSLEKSMDCAKKICNLGRAVRENENIKVRQPVSQIILPEEIKKDVESLIDVIKEELNVRDIVFTSDKSKFMNFSFVPNFKVAGKILGNKIGAFKKYLEEQTTLPTGSIELDGQTFDITDDMVEVRIESKEGFASEMEGELFLIMDTEITEELKELGLLREFISKIQQIRKKEDLEMMDNIKIFVTTSDDLMNVINKHKQFILDETLSKEIASGGSESFDINGIETKIAIEKI